MVDYQINEYEFGVVVGKIKTRFCSLNKAVRLPAPLVGHIALNNCMHSLAVQIAW